MGNPWKTTPEECMQFCKSKNSTIAVYRPDNKNCACCHDPPGSVRYSSTFRMYQCVRSKATQSTQITTTITTPITTALISTKSSANLCNGVPSTNWNCCTNAKPCSIGGGDCDRDSDCITNLVCGRNNCKKDFTSQGSNWNMLADCCYKKNVVD